MPTKWLSEYTRSRFDEARRIVEALVGKGGFVIEVSEPDQPFTMTEMEYQADQLRRHIQWITGNAPDFLRKVVEAVREYVEAYCEKVKGEEFRGFEYTERIGVYKCESPSAGMFYMVLMDIHDYHYNSDTIKLYTTKSLSEALEEYQEAEAELEGGPLWLEE